MIRTNRRLLNQQRRPKIRLERVSPIAGYPHPRNFPSFAFHPAIASGTPQAGQPSVAFGPLRSPQKRPAAAFRSISQGKRTLFPHSSNHPIWATVSGSLTAVKPAQGLVTGRSWKLESIPQRVQNSSAFIKQSRFKSSL